MTKLTQLLDRFRNLVDRIPIDNKLLYAGIAYVVSAALTALAVEIGIPLDVNLGSPVTLEQAINAIAAAVAGYFAHNYGSALRAGSLDSGNPELPADFTPATKGSKTPASEQPSQPLPGV